jgi:hypothetical protein
MTNTIEEAEAQQKAYYEDGPMPGSPEWLNSTSAEDMVYGYAAPYGYGAKMIMDSASLVHGSYF